jgi:hypothetical protein
MSIKEELETLVAEVEALSEYVSTEFEKKRVRDEDLRRLREEQSDPFTALLHIYEEEDLVREFAALGENAPVKSRKGGVWASVALRQVANEIRASDTQTHLWSEAVADAFIFAEEKLKAREVTNQLRADKTVESALRHARTAAHDKEHPDNGQEDEDGGDSVPKHRAARFKGLFLMAAGMRREEELAKEENRTKNVHDVVSIMHSTQSNYSRPHPNFESQSRANSPSPITKSSGEAVEDTKTLSHSMITHGFESYVVIVGVGGIGGMIAEVLTRCGVQDLLLVDKKEKTSLSDLSFNGFYGQQLGQSRAQVVAESCHAINPSATRVVARPLVCDVETEEGFESFVKYLMMCEWEVEWDILVKHKGLDYVMSKEGMRRQAHVSEFEKSKRMPNLIICTCASKEVVSKVNRLCGELKLGLILVYMNRDGISGGSVRFTKPAPIARVSLSHHRARDEKKAKDSEKAAAVEEDASMIPRRVKWPSTMNVLAGLASDMALQYIWGGEKASAIPQHLVKFDGHNLCTVAPRTK